MDLLVVLHLLEDHGRAFLAKCIMQTSSAGPPDGEKKRCLDEVASWE